MKFLKLPQEVAVPREDVEGEGEERENERHCSDDDTISLSQLSTLTNSAASTDAEEESGEKNEEDTELSSLSDASEEEEEEGPQTKKAR